MKTQIDSAHLYRCYETAREALLAERNERGHWTGELSTSALSTATAVMALEMVRRQRVSQSPGADASGSRETLQTLIDGGLCWLAAHQNEDGGWGDTTKSFSNISTSMLAHAVFHATGNGHTESAGVAGTESGSVGRRYTSVVQKAVAYIDRIGGVDAVVERYGRDKTFSIPILTHCALAGLVPWKAVSALPFELACLSPKFYKSVRLPVVSYALPALIAIGQVRHYFRKPWNPLFRLIRRLAIKPSLRRLESIQPVNGGFLEAAPLTSFVTMSLAGMGLADHSVAKKGVQFLRNSVRPDGSWPIDTNLATWVTTMSVNALGDDLPVEDRPAIRDWLLDQQYKEIHPYTNADPGGWSWTDLPGGVPDGDDTPGVMLALITLSQSEPDPDDTQSEPDPDDTQSEPDRVGPDRGDTPRLYSQTDQSSLENAACWLSNLQNRDGGFPTFCRGWGKLPFDRSSADITAHCLRALSKWCEQRFDNRPMPAIFRGFDFLKKQQRSDGSWLPLWFGNQHALHEENPTYGTSRVLAAYRDCKRIDTEEAQRGLDWLRTNQNDDGGWGGTHGVPASIEETALATEIFLSIEPGEEPAQRGLAWLFGRIEDKSFREPTPIGFYFAKLWYFERLYPLSLMVAALRTAVQQKTKPGLALPNDKPARDGSSADAAENLKSQPVVGKDEIR